jgi:hypothetical protein
MTVPLRTATSLRGNMSSYYYVNGKRYGNCGHKHKYLHKALECLMVERQKKDSNSKLYHRDNNGERSLVKHWDFFLEEMYGFKINK